MKAKFFILGSMLLAAILPATAQTTTTPSSGSTGDGSFTPFAKGSFNISGSIGYTTSGSSTTTNLTSLSSKYDSTAVPNGKSSTFTVDLNPGYLIADNFQVGLVLDYTTSTTLQNSEYYQNNIYTNYSWNNITDEAKLGINVIKYFPLGHNFYFKCALAAAYVTGSTSSSSLQTIEVNPNPIPTLVASIVPNPAESISGFGAILSPGLEYFPARKWGINFNLNDVVSYTSIKTSNTNPSYANGVLASSQNVTTSHLTVGAGLTPTIGVRYFF